MLKKLKNKKNSERKPERMDKVRVAIIGVGNCASSLVQGVEYYKNARESDFIPGVMHINLGGYSYDQV